MADVLREARKDEAGDALEYGRLWGDRLPCFSSVLLFLLLFFSELNSGECFRLLALFFLGLNI